MCVCKRVRERLHVYKCVQKGEAACVSECLLCVCVCVCARARACVRVFKVRVRLCVFVCERECVSVCDTRERERVRKTINCFFCSQSNEEKAVK